MNSDDVIKEALNNKQKMAKYTRRQSLLNHAINLAIMLKKERIYSGVKTEVKENRGYKNITVTTRKIARNQLRNEVGSRYMKQVWNRTLRKEIQAIYGEKYENLTKDTSNIN